MLICGKMKSIEKAIRIIECKKVIKKDTESKLADVEKLEKRVLRVFQTHTESLSQNLNEQGTDLIQEMFEAGLKGQGAIECRSDDHQTNLPLKRLIQSNIERSAESYFSSPKNGLSEMPKYRERVEKQQNTHLDFFELMKEQLQQKGFENQHLVDLLSLKHLELNNVNELSKKKEQEIQLVTDQLRLEEQKNGNLTARFEQDCEELKQKLRTAEHGSANMAEQLKSLQEKNELLKTHASTLKSQLGLELRERANLDKSLKKLQQKAREMLTKQNQIEDQRDAAGRELASCQEKLKMMDAEQKTTMSENRRLEAELSAMRSESEDLQEHLHKVQEKNKELVEMTLSNDSESKRTAKKSQDLLEQLNMNLEKCQTEKNKALQHVETLKRDLISMYNQQKVEIHQLQEKQQATSQQTVDLRKECETLIKMVVRLKTDKKFFTEKLEMVQKEKVESEKSNKEESERLKEVLRKVGREKDMLRKEMEELAKDYVGLSDRIVQKKARLGSDDPKTTTTTNTSSSENTKKEDEPVLSSHDVIDKIRRKLEEENTCQRL